IPCRNRPYTSVRMPRESQCQRFQKGRLAGIILPGDYVEALRELERGRLTKALVVPDLKARNVHFSNLPKFSLAANASAKTVPMPRNQPDNRTIGDRRDVFCYFVRLAIDQTCLTLTSSTGILSLMNFWDQLGAVRCS